MLRVPYFNLCHHGANQNLVGGLSCIFHVPSWNLWDDVAICCNKWWLFIFFASKPTVATVEVMVKSPAWPRCPWSVALQISIRTSSATAPCSLHAAVRSNGKPRCNWSRTTGSFEGVGRKQRSNPSGMCRVSNWWWFHQNHLRWSKTWYRMDHTSKSTQSWGAPIPLNFNLIIYWDCRSINFNMVAVADVQNSWTASHDSDVPWIFIFRLLSFIHPWCRDVVRSTCCPVKVMWHVLPFIFRHHSA